MTTSNTVIINEIPVDPTDNTKTAWGPTLASQYFFVIANGTAAAETFDAADISAATRTLMATYGRGITVNMGAGNDTVIGSAYGDTFNLGDGTNYADGGDNQGTLPGGARARDVLNVFAASQAAADALTVVAIDAAATGADGEAYAAGYRIKVSNGTEIDYLKNVEQVNVFVSSGSSYAFAKTVQLAINVMEADGSTDVSNNLDLAWVQGSQFNDSFDANTDISAATRTLMDQHKRGVWVDLGAGDDTVVGSAYGDDISVGAGTNYVDGGGNAGSPPWGGKAQDVLHVTVATQAAADAVQVVQLTAGMTGADAQAFTNGYTHKVMAGAETDYIKGIERVSVQVAAANGGSTWARDIPLTVVVQEANLADTSANYYHLAWVNGTAGADTIDLSSGSTLLSSELQAALVARGHGVWVDGGAGNDTITGTAFADNFRNGAGNSKIDGGANAGGMDVFEITVASTAEMSAVQVSASDDPAWQYMVTYGSGSTQKDYLKNIEAITINVAGTTTGKWIPLAVNVNEIAASGDLANSMHYAWAQGTTQDDHFDATTDVSAATRTLMDQHKRGVWVDLGAGNDTVTGSAYGDDINVGAGTNYVDGGGNAGSPPWGGKAQDVLHVTVADQAAAAAVQVTQLTAGMSGADAQAFTNGYTHKVVAGAETDYIKGIERVSIEVAANGGGSTWARDVPLTVVVQEANLADPASVNYYHLAWVNGTAGNDSIDLSSGSTLLSSELQAAMAARGRGVWVDAGAGNDTITGTAFADNFRNGPGNSKIDGGANAGPGGAKGNDVFEIAVASTAELNAIQVSLSDDPAYQWMVTYGSGSTQKDYLKNIEAVSINVTGTSTGKWIALAQTVYEIPSSGDLANSLDYAWAQGTALDETFNAATDISAATRTLMDQHQRGVWVDMGAGNDTVTGSGYGDDINAGAGTNYVDGGANAGSPPWGGKAIDVLRVTVADQAAADAVQVTQLAAGMSGADAQAFTNGYTYKVVAGGETDYIKNIERVTVQVAGANGSTTWARDIPLTVLVQEVNTSDPNAVKGSTLAWVTGTAGADTIDLSGDTPLLSSALKAAMATNKHGVYVDGGAGNDVITGTAYADYFRNGQGNSKIDGGTEIAPDGQQGRDVFDITVGGAAEMAAITVAVSDDPAYAFMVTYGSGSTQKDYLKNIEGIWLHESATGTSKWIDLAPPPVPVPNTAPTFTGVPAGVAVSDFGADYGALGGIALASGKLLTVSYGATPGADYMLYLTRANADGSIDTSFGGGTGRVLVPTSFGTTATALELSGGKLLVGVSTYGSTGDFRVLRLSADGGVDTTFGTNGSTTVSFGSGADSLRKILVDGSGKILMVGNTESATGRDLAVVRLNADGSLDNTFNGSGKFTLSLGSGNAVANAVAVQADGKLVLAGYAPNGSLNEVAVVRLNADGTLDTTFGSGGKVLMPIGPGANLATTVEVLASGKILLGGYARTGADASTDWDAALVRLNADGSADASFGTGGVVKTHLSDFNDNVLAMKVQADGKIVMLSDTGYNASSMNGKVAVLRYNADGTLDTSFGNNGVAKITIHGIAEQPNSLALVGDKIVVFGSSVNDTNFDTSNVIVRLNANGTPDTTFGVNNPTSLGGTIKVDGIHPVALDANAAIYDYELASGDNYAGATLTLARHGGANAEDVFRPVGEVTVDATGNVIIGTIVIGTVTQSAGTLTVTFNTNATQGLVNRALHGIGYTNASSTPPSSVTIDWAFSDGTASHPLSATGSTTVQIGMQVYEKLHSVTNPDTAPDGTLLANLNYPGVVNGTAAADTFDSATGFSAAQRAVMDQYKHGAFFDMGPGDDTVTGTGYSDLFILGGGTNKVDGGANAGTLNGAAGKDIVNVYATSKAAADAVSVVKLDASATGADKAAFDAGYDVKVVNGGEIDYLKNVEQVNIFQWTDANGDGLRQSNESTFSRGVQLVLGVNEIVQSATDPTKDNGGTPLSTYSAFAWANGWNGNDSFNAATDVSAATRALMDQYGRGVWVNTGAGNDTAVGSAYADWFDMGTGTNYVDGGANGGSNPWGGQPRDQLNVTVAAADAGKVSVVALTAGMSDATDAAAYSAGYTWKVMAGAEIDYVKGIEVVNVNAWTDANSNGVRDNGEVQYHHRIALSMLVDEVSVSTTDPTRDSGGNLLSTYGQLAWGEGTNGNDTFNAATDVTAATRALMAQVGRGVFVDTRAGNDTVVGSNWGDYIRAGAGVKHIDGGANQGTDTTGHAARDTLELLVADQAAADAVAVTKLTADMTGADGQAYADGYTHKVVNGSVSTDYVKNIEQVNIQIWTDKNGNGLPDFASSTDPANEVTFARSIDLTTPPVAPNTAPTFTGVPAGVAVSDFGADYGALGGIALASGKLLTVSYGTTPGADYMIYLTRANADGSVDTSFGGGSGRVQIPTSYGSVAAPLELSGGKLLVGVSTYGATADFRVLRMNADGSVDTTFGASGSTTVSLGSGAESLRKILVDGSGKIVMVGNTESATGRDLAVVRLNADGSLDTSFNSSGKFTLSLGAGNAAANAVAVQADGKLVLAGFAPNGSVNEVAVVRMNADGTLDTTFGSGGKVLMPIGPGANLATTVEVLASGKILLGGYARTGADSTTDWDPALVRLNADGSADTTFGTAGVVKTHLSNFNDNLVAMKVQADGKILVLSDSGFNSSSMNGQVAVLRYNADGTLDTSFGSGGVAKTTVHGISEQPNSLALVGDKIVVFGSSVNDGKYDTSNFILRLNADGTPDATFGVSNPSSLGGTVKGDGIHPVALDANVSIFDAELSKAGSYAGATLTFARHGGASADDTYFPVNELTADDNGNLMIGTVIVATGTENAGTLTLTFTAAATQGLVNRVMHGIGYANTSATPPSSVIMDWTFSDGNSGAQGTGGALSATGSTTVQIGMRVYEKVASVNNPANAPDGTPLATLTYPGVVNGTAAADSFDSATGFSAAQLAVMDQYKHGGYYDMGPGDNNVTGTGYSDLFVLGAGTNKVDGGAQAGTLNGTAGKDIVNVYATSQAAADAVTVVKLDATATGADKTAFDAGYDVKVTNGAEIDYLKNIEQVNIFTWTDSNDDGLRQSGETVYARGESLVLSVNELPVSPTDATKDTAGHPLKDAWNFAWANGWYGNDSFNVATDVSAATRTLMDQYGRGVWASLGDGNDTFVGSAWGDTVELGRGTNYADGGANGGTNPNGVMARDELDIYVAPGTTVSSLKLTTGMSDATDAAAFAAGYTYKIMAGAEIDYVKNIEVANIWNWTDANHNGQREGSEMSWYGRIPFSLVVDEVTPNSTLNTLPQMAWAYGGPGDDSFSVSANVSAATRALMGQYKAGAWIDMGDGNDVVVGSDYADNINLGKGVNKADGGANLPGNASGNQARDVLEMMVSSQAEADAVTSTALTADMSGADGAAYAEGYRFKIANGTSEIDYVKNIEDVRVMIWNDLNHNGQRDYGTDANEVTFGRMITLVPDSPPSFAGAPAGVALIRAGFDFTPTGLATMADGRMLTLSLMDMVANGDNYTTALARHNPDGSLDTSFGSGGMVLLPVSFGSVIAPPVVLADGKVLMAVSSTWAPGADFKVVRLNADGTVDGSFGTNGAAIVSLGAGSDTPTKLMVQADGKIVVAGNAGSASGGDMAAVRLTASGQLDTAFNGTGTLVVAASAGIDRASAAVLQGDGKLLLAGTAAGASDLDFALVRVNADGSLDTSFGSGGKVLLPVGTGDDRAYSVVVQGDGKILLAGDAFNGAAADLALARFNADGSVDTSFGSGGKVVLHQSGAVDRGQYMLVQDDGKIVTAGWSGGTANGGALTVTRLNADGSLDSGFGNHGVVALALQGMDNRAAGLALVNGKLVVLGISSFNVDADASMALVRLNMDGSLDSTFGTPYANSLPFNVQADGLHPALLAFNGALYDAELAGQGNYAYASLNIARQGGASADDVFVASGEVSFANHVLSVGGTAIGTVDQSGGSLVIHFSDAATQGLVNRALHGIAYTNAGAAPGASVTLQWKLADEQNIASYMSTTVQIGVTVAETVRAFVDPTLDTTGAKLSTLPWLATVSGSLHGETFSADAALSNQVKALMAELGRGADIQTHGGGDTVSGTAFGDHFVTGAGVNYIDGGANGGTDPSGAAAVDVLEVFVASQAAADAVQLVALNAQSTGADLAAYNAGYLFKVNAGSETDYLKNVEKVQVTIWTDLNGNHLQETAELTAAKLIGVPAA
ncbi:hypothetical protein GCM10027321_38560 [Massilia terrae]|uniref:Uncharacterized protein n=1 Tax=Massilia terrae TaxID=1811224 RepID=A0ABT2CXT9_9BURK|nr:hypothetical protein [Massilia terrae]MCS0658796.1 hypothetical protein [Massilia terrae]